MVISNLSLGQHDCISIPFILSSFQSHSPRWCFDTYVHYMSTAFFHPSDTREAEELQSPETQGQELHHYLGAQGKNMICWLSHKDIIHQNLWQLCIVLCIMLKGKVPAPSTPTASRESVRESYTKEVFRWPCMKSGREELMGSNL